MIPKIIHQIYQTRNGQPIPYQIKEWVNRCKSTNTTHEHWFWTDENKNEGFVSENFPSFFQQYKSLPFDVQRYDVLRLMILYVYGGVYIDTDVLFFKEIDETVIGSDDTCLFALEPEQHAFDFERMPFFVGTYFIAAEKGNPFIWQLLSRIFSTAHIKRSVHQPTQVMKSTGCARVTEIYQEEKKNYRIRLLPSELLSPLTAKESKKFLFGKYYPQVECAYAQHIYAGTWVSDTENKTELELMNFLKMQDKN